MIKTGVVEIPVKLLGENEAAASTLLAKRTRARKWAEVLDGLEPVDNRVLWTFEDGVTKIVFRYEVEEGPRVGHG